MSTTESEPYTQPTEDVVFPPQVHSERKMRCFTEEGLRAHDAEVIERYADSFEYQGGRARDAREYAARLRRGEGE